MWRMLWDACNTIVKVVGPGAKLVERRCGGCVVYMCYSVYIIYLLDPLQVCRLANHLPALQAANPSLIPLDRNHAVEDAHIQGASPGLSFCTLSSHFHARRVSAPMLRLLAIARLLRSRRLSSLASRFCNRSGVISSSCFAESDVRRMWCQTLRAES